MRMVGEFRLNAVRMGMAVAVVLGLAYAAFAGMPVAQAHADDGALAAGGALKAQGVGVQAVDHDIAWYTSNPNADEFTILNVRDLRGFAKLVNGTVDASVSGKPADAVTFEGKTVKLGGPLNLTGQQVEPIGTEEHPFQGTFDGQSTPETSPELYNYTLVVSDSGDDISNKGLFGYAGDKASIKNLDISGSVKVTNQTDGKKITNVGAIAGHLGGNIENCKSTVKVYVTNDGKVPALDKPGKMPDEICTIMYVGGLVGSLEGDLINCVHGNDNGVDKDAVLAISSSSAATENVPFIASYVGGLVGLQGDEAHGDIVWETTNCANYGKLDFSGIKGEATADRFGNINYAKSSNVGGIAGYSIASFSNCKNLATINTGVIGENGNPKAEYGARNTGGIVGALRAPRVTNPTVEMVSMGTDATDPGYDVWLNSNGATKAPLLTVERCQNTGDIIGLAAVGGIVGSDGAFTKVVGCTNSGNVDGTRSVKPCPAGVAGISNGDIAYCSNTGRIRTTTGAGYYASGIAALLTTYNISSTDASLMLEAAQIYGCYTTGQIVSTAAGGFRTAVIAAENDGFIHDNCFLPNLTVDKVVPKEWQAVLDLIADDGAISAENVATVSEMLERVNILEKRASFTIVGDKLSGGTKAELEKYCTRSQLVVPDEDRGTRARNFELTVDELKSSVGVAYLNRPVGIVGDWSDTVNYYRVSASGDSPVLNWLGGGLAGSVDLSTADGLSVEVMQNPEYAAAGAPAPELRVTLAGTKLYQNADYKVVVDENATEPGVDYQVAITGMNAYTGTRANVATYQVRKCDVANCKVAATTQVFNWKKQKPAKVTLVDDAGNVLAVDEKGSADSGAEFVWSLPEMPDGASDQVRLGEKKYSDGKYYDYTHVHAKGHRYDVIVEAKETSSYYEGSTRQAAFQIKTASLYHGPLGSSAEGHDRTAHYDKVVWGDQEWDYLESYLTKGLVKIKYTGSPIRPTIKNPTYLDEELIDGTGNETDSLLHPFKYHFRYIYGNPNPDPSNVVDFNCVNATGSDEANLACMTLRYLPNTDFDNYINVFFEITPASIEDDVAVSGGGGSYPYTGKQITCPFKLTYNGMMLKEDIDYTVRYANNVNLGTATATITGKGNYAGSVTRAFSIVAATNPLSVKALNKTVKAKKLAKKAQKVVAFNISGAAGKVSVKLVKNKKTKKFKVNSKGKVTVPKGTKKGIYKVKVVVTAAGDGGHMPASATVTAKVKVK